MQRMVGSLFVVGEAMAPGTGGGALAVERSAIAPSPQNFHIQLKLGSHLPLYRNSKFGQTFDPVKYRHLWTGKKHDRYCESCGMSKNAKNIKQGCRILDAIKRRMKWSWRQLGWQP